jgi:hypothetical protein
MAVTYFVFYMTVQYETSSGLIDSGFFASNNTGDVFFERELGDSLEYL